MVFMKVYLLHMKFCLFLCKLTQIYPNSVVFLSTINVSSPWSTGVFLEYSTGDFTKATLVWHVRPQLDVLSTCQGMCWVAEMSWDSGSADSPVVWGPGTQLIMAPGRESGLWWEALREESYMTLEMNLKRVNGSLEEEEVRKKAPCTWNYLIAPSENHKSLHGREWLIWKGDSKCLWEACSSSVCSPLPGVP